MNNQDRRFTRYFTTSAVRCQLKDHDRISVDGDPSKPCLICTLRERLEAVLNEQLKVMGDNSVLEELTAEAEKYKLGY